MELMLLVKERMRLDEIPLPKNYFDMIGGSGTGGLLAIMLGRFGMSATACVRNYADLSRMIFQDSNKKLRNPLSSWRPSFEAITLENAMKRIAQENGSHPEASLVSEEDGDRGCKV